MLTREEQRLLALFADNQKHSFFETCILARVLFKKGDKYIWNLFNRKLLFNGWVRRLHESYSPHLDFYQLTPKGDECFRANQLAILSRGKSNEEAKRHYMHFDRNVLGKYGVEGMGKTISEKAAGLRDRFPHLYE